MHVLIIHQAFASPDEPGGTRHYEFARYLVDKGHKVTIIASNLSYLSGQPSADSVPLAGRLQYSNGIQVIRAYTYPALHRSFVWRVVSFFSFVLTSLLAAMRVQNIDLVMGTSPPIFQAVSALLVSFLRFRPFLLEIRDLWPEFAIDMGVLKSKPLIYLSRWLEGFLYVRSSYLLVNSPAYRKYLVKKGVPVSKISVIPNGVDPQRFDESNNGERIRHEFGLDGKFVATYAGALGLANDISTILEAAKSLRDKNDIRFLLVGDGKERTHMEALAKQWDLPNVIFIGARPKSKMGEILAASDGGIAILQDIPMFRTTYPNKVFDYMAAGRPTILAIDGVIRQVVEAAKGGIFVPPGNSGALAEAISNLAENPSRAKAMGISARKYVKENFNRADQAQEFLELLCGVTQKKVRVLFYVSFGKRLADLLLAVPALIVLSPMISLLIVMVYAKIGRPIFFQQKRPGLRGQLFRMYKFRTMTNERNSGGKLLPDDKRLTKFGSLLRKTSLDELPELFNVLKGDMSFVGPRPLLMQYLDRYTQEQMRRHEVKPGITGWAQVNGRNAITWEQKFEHDVWYVDHVSLWLDLKIIAMTIWKVLKGEGINQPGQATAEEFMPHAKAQRR